MSNHGPRLRLSLLPHRYRLWRIRLESTGKPSPCSITTARLLTRQDAQVNNIGCRLRNGPTKLSIIQACFSIGGTLSPFFATPFAERVPDRPYLYFYIAMAVALFTLTIMLLAFVNGGIDGIISGRGMKVEQAPIAREGESGYPAVRRVEEDLRPLKPMDEDHSWGKIRRMVSNPLVLSLMLWSFFYASCNPLRASQQN